MKNYLTLVTIDLRQSSNTRGTVISSTSSSCFKSVLLYILQNFKVNDLRAFTSLNAECLTESLASSDINANEVKNIILYSFEISCHFLVCAYIKSVRHRHAAWRLRHASDLIPETQEVNISLHLSVMKEDSSFTGIREDQSYLIVSWTSWFGS